MQSWTHKSRCLMRLRLPDHESWWRKQDLHGVQSRTQGNRRRVWLRLRQKVAIGNIHQITLVVLLNKLYLPDTWNKQPEYAETSAGASSYRIEYKYSTKAVYFVAGSAKNSHWNWSLSWYTSIMKPTSRARMCQWFTFISLKEFILIISAQLSLRILCIE